LTKKIEIFGRYDHLLSNTLTNTVDPWNYALDGDAVIGGIQYIANKWLRVALNYQGFLFNKPGAHDNHGVFVNLEFRN